jgi:hypothetical protein
LVESYLMTSKLLPNLVVRAVDLPIPPTCLAALRRQSRLGHFRCWHKCEVPPDFENVCFSGKTGSDRHTVKLTRLTLNGHLTAWITAKAFTLRSSTLGYGPMRPTGVHWNDCWRRSLAGEERRRAMRSTLLSAAPRSSLSWEPAEVQLRPTAIPDRAASRLN